MKKKILGISIITLFLILSIFQTGAVSNTVYMNQSKELNERTSDRPYTGYLRVYIVEPESRWNNYDRNPYHYGFLDFAINEQVSINYHDTYTTQVTWSALEAGYNNVKENNVMAIAVVFNPTENNGFANPPNKNPFDAHYVDAAAGAKPGETGVNIVNENFTHTVFIEEATAQFCPYCPAMAEAMNNISESGDYPFYFLALITKDYQRNTINQVAFDYLVDSYNLYAYPSAFFDGGKKVLVGGYDEESMYRTRIEQCGKADVHEMNLNLSVVWEGNGVLDITVTIINNEEMPNGEPSLPIITGPSSGKPYKKYDFNIKATDPEGEQVWYWIDWGDGTNTSWLGPFDSGVEITESHTWKSIENFTVKVKAKDVLDAESDWATLIISVPCMYRIPTTTLWKQLFELYSHIFPILQHLLHY